MMKPVQFSALLLLFLISCQESYTPMTDLESANLKGRVLRIDRTFHDAGARSACPAADKNEYNRSSYTYNEDGNLAESVLIGEKDKSVTSKYIYNKSGICREVTKFAEERPAGREVLVTSGNRITAIKIYDENNENTMTYKYSWSGNNVTQEQAVDGTGNITGITENEYEGNRLVAQTVKDGEGNIKTITRFKKNQGDDITETSIRLPKDNSEFVFTYEYEYDNQGNWTKQTQYYQGNIVSIVIRNIEYYPVS